MSKFILKDQKVLLGKENLTSMIRTFGFSGKGESFDAVTLGMNSKEKLVGLPDAELSLEGFWESGPGSLDEALFTGIGSTEEPIAIVLSENGTTGTYAHFFKAKHGTLKLFGEGNQPCPFSATAVCSGRPLKGWNMKHGIITVGANGTGIALGPVGATQSMFAGLCVTQATALVGLIVTIQSDDNAGFTTPTTQMTFSTLAVTGSQLMSVAGAITDSYWRAVWALTSGSAEITVVLGRAQTIL